MLYGSCQFDRLEVYVFFRNCKYIFYIFAEPTSTTSQGYILGNPVDLNGDLFWVQRRVNAGRTSVSSSSGVGLRLCEAHFGHKESDKVDVNFWKFDVPFLNFQVLCVILNFELNFEDFAEQARHQDMSLITITVKIN